MKKYITIVLCTIILLTQPTTIAIASANRTWSTTKLNDWASVAVVIGNQFGIDIIGKFIHTFYTKQDDIAVPDHEPLAIFQKKLTQYYTSDWFTSNNKINPFTQKIIISSLYCAIISSHTKYADSNPTVKYILSDPGSVEKSDPIPFANESFQASEWLAASKALYEKNPNASGILDFNWPDRILAGISAEDCRKHREGEDNEPIPAGLTSLAHFGGDAFVFGFMPVTIMEWVSHIVQGVATLIERPIITPVRNSVVLTQKSMNEYFSHHCYVGKCPGDEVQDETANLDKQGGYTNELLPYDEKRSIKTFANTYYDIYIDGFGKAASLQDSYNVYNNAKEYIKMYGCAGTPDGYQKNVSLSSNKIPIADACTPKKNMCSEADTWEEVLQKLPKSIGDVCTKYASNLPISKDQCVNMMNQIFNIEIRYDPEWSGENYRCEHRSDSTAAGPFQLIDGTYKLVTCPNEQMKNDIGECKTKKDQLSRCSTEDAAELAMRVILNYSSCNNAGSLGSTSELYTSLCNYGTGVCQPQSNLDNKTYCEYIFDAVGIPKPQETCATTGGTTTPLPPN